MLADPPTTREAIAERVARMLREAIDAGQYPLVYCCPARN